MTVGSQEIRTIREDESEDFIKAICEVFKIKLDLAKNFYFSDPFYDLDRKWALFESGRMVAILTTTGLEFGWGRAMGIAGVGTLESERGRGLARRLLSHVLESAEALGEAPALLFALDTKLYESVGFEAVDDVIQGLIKGSREFSDSEIVDSEFVHDHYATWQSRDPNRLVRDSLRWKHWQFAFRTAYRQNGGYLTVESGLCREIVPGVDEELSDLPEVMWLGLRSMSDMLGLDIDGPEVKMKLMARGFKALPQMHMSDQF